MPPQEYRSPLISRAGPEGEGWTVSIFGHKNHTLWLKTLNGEREYFDFANLSTTRSSRALPQKMEVDWEDRFGTKHEAHITFDDSEVTAAFLKLTEKKSDNAMQLQLEITDVPRVIHSSLTDGRYIIRLNKNEIRAFKRRSL